MLDYRSRITVQAARINKLVSIREDGDTMIVFDKQDGEEPQLVTWVFMKAHNPKVGDYFVVYPGGEVHIMDSESFSHQFVYHAKVPSLRSGE